MCGSKNSLYTPSWLFTRPHFSFSPPNHKLLEILNSKSSKLAKSSVPKPQIWLKFSSHGYILSRNSVHLGSQIQQCIHKPLCSALWVKNLYQNESWVECPPPMYTVLGRWANIPWQIWKPNQGIVPSLICQHPELMKWNRGGDEHIIRDIIVNQRIKVNLQELDEFNNK